MNEDQIKTRLQDHLTAQNAMPEETGLISEQTIELPKIEAMHNNLPLDNMVLEQNVMDILNIPNGARQSAETKNQIDSIMRWASENAGNKEMSSILETIQRQVRMMGAQLSTDKVQKLYRFVKLSSVRDSIELQMRSL